MGLELAEEFRSGNVSAHAQLLPTVLRGFEALLKSVAGHSFRGNAACWKRELVNWLRDEQRPEGPQGRITFAINVPMMWQLKKHHMERLAETMGKAYREDVEAASESADLWHYRPEEEDRPEAAAPTGGVGRSLDTVVNHGVGRELTGGLRPLQV